ncbi:MAG: methionine adenosyltransferase, partial [Gemmatimonadetes bacterium]|nr:methionine adenosyltransferase [Gemmatimonadota bacterium]
MRRGPRSAQGTLSRGTRMATFDAEKFSYIFSSESVSEGHPDKVADFVADSILDAHIAQDPQAHVACEVLVKEGNLILAGEISSQAKVDAPAVARAAVRAIGYTDPEQAFSADRIVIQTLLTEQAREIGAAVNREGEEEAEQGAGDQGIMFGYATDETPELMPLPILLAHTLARIMARHRHDGSVAWLRPDSKTQVSVRYDEEGPQGVTDVLVSTMHARGVSQALIREWVHDVLLPEALGRWNHPDIRLIVNPSGSFEQGGPSADAGVTGRKIIVDSYGGMARHGGGAFS